jgi:hypothetical protein
LLSNGKWLVNNKCHRHFLLLDLYLHDHQNVFSKEFNFITTISNIFDNVFSKTCHIFVYLPYRTWARLYISATVGPASSWTGTTSPAFLHIFFYNQQCSCHLLFSRFFPGMASLWYFRNILNFQTQLLTMQGQPWLKYTDGLMFCTACKEDEVTENDSVFVLSC